MEAASHPTNPMTTTNEQLVREKQLHNVDGLSKTTRNDYIKAGLYPKPVRLGPRCKAWKMSEVQAWIASRPLAADVEAE